MLGELYMVIHVADICQQGSKLVFIRSVGTFIDAKHLFFDSKYRGANLFFLYRCFTRFLQSERSRG